MWSLQISTHKAARSAGGFTYTQPPPPPPGATDIVLYASEATRAGNWQVVSDSTAAGGARIHNPDQGAPKRSTALANPADYFEMTFNAQANTPYRLWIRGKAQSDNWANDSIFIQFSGQRHEQPDAYLQDRDYVGNGDEP